MTRNRRFVAAADRFADGFVRSVLWLARFIIGTLILASVAINCANVIGRYLFLSPIVWAEEVMIYIMVWCVFIGAVLVTTDGQHLKMDILSSMVGARWRRIINLASTVAIIAVCGFVVVQSYRVVTLFAGLGQVSTVAGIPMALPHAAVLIGFGLMLAVVLLRLREHLAGAAAAPAWSGIDDGDRH